jgi:putative peptidoglycan lipid II flippase
LAEAHVEGRQQEFLNDLARSIRMVLVFAIPVAMMVSILATPLIELVFQHGAFDESATRGVVSLLPIMMIGMVAMLCVVIMFRALYARQQVLPAALLGTMVLALYFILSGLLSRLMMVQGIALAYAFSWWATLLAALALVWRDNMRSLFPKKAIIFSLQVIGAVTLMSVVMYAFSVLWISPLNDIGYLKLCLRTSLIGMAGLIIYYFAAAKLISIPEVLHVSERLLQGFKGAKA